MWYTSLITSIQIPSTSGSRPAVHKLLLQNSSSWCDNLRYVSGNVMQHWMCFLVNFVLHTFVSLHLIVDRWCFLVVHVSVNFWLHIFIVFYVVTVLSYLDFSCKFSRGFWATICKTVCPMLPDHCPSLLSVCDVDVLWLNGWMHQDETWHGGRPQPQPHCVGFVG